MVREERGTYRAIHSVLIDSHDFTDLSDDAKLAFYTLRFCPENNLASIFSPFYLEILNHRMRMGHDRLLIAIQELMDSHWIVYQQPVLWIRNGLKFSPGISLDNPKHMAAILKVIKGLPKLRIVGEFCAYYQIKCPFQDSLSNRLYNSLSPSYPIQEKEKVLGKGKGKGKREGIGEGVQGENLPSEILNGFNAFWESYPKKEGKDEAQASWLKKHKATKLAPKDVPLQEILSGLERWKHSKKWLDDGFITMPSTWLNQGRWKDDPEPSRGAQLPGVNAALRVAQDLRDRQTRDR